MDQIIAGLRSDDDLAPGRPDRLVVDLAAIRANLRAIRAAVGGETKIFAPLKANAYGFGLVRVGKALEAEGIDALSVVDAVDAIHLRDAGVRIPILVSRSGFTAWGVELARKANLTLIGRAKGSRFIVLAGAERIVYDADARAVVEEGRSRKASVDADNS